MKFELDKTNKNFIECLYGDIKVNSIEDIYLGVGKIIQISQQWENEFRELCELCNCKIANLETATLNKQNDRLHDDKVFNNEEYEKLKEVIKFRNFINHQFFLDDDWHYPLEDTEKTLNGIYFLINEGRDCIANEIDKLKENNIGQRPTVLNK